MLSIVCVAIFAATPLTTLDAQSNIDSPATRTQQLDPREIVAGPREMLDLYQIGESQLSMFTDGETIGDDSLGTLVRLLYRTPSFPLQKIHRWQQWENDVDQIAAEPNQFRGAILKLVGEVTQIESVSMSDSFAERFGFASYFRVQMTTEVTTATVYCREVPSAWLSQVDHGAPLSISSSVSAMFVQLGTPPQPTQGRPHLVAVAHRFAWHPRAPDSANGITPDHVFLCQYGLDASQFDTVEDRKPLTAFDRECFYQLLDTVGTMPSDVLANHAAPSVNVTQLLQFPDRLRAQHCTLTGTVRRAIRIEVDDTDITQRFGIDHYYEVEIFTEPDAVIKFKGNDSDGATSENQDGGDNEKTFYSYPVVVCFRELPDWMPQGDAVHANVRFSGFFLKQWAYKTQFMSEGTAPGERERLQISPLLIGSRLSQSEYVDTGARIWGPLFGGMFAALVAGIGIYVWRSEKSDREFRRRRQANSVTEFPSDES